jgi:Na+/H+ antiporter NhaD/arsenite permease-like protein
MILSLVIFGSLYVAITTDIINKTTVALFAAMLTIILGISSQAKAFAHIDLNVIFLLIGMMIIMGIAKQTGVFQYMAIKIAKFARGDPVAIIILLSLTTALISAFLDNVTTVLIIVPITILIAVELGLSPTPFVITQAIASNVGGTATLIGDPPNIMIGSAANLSFIDFLTNLTPAILIILVVNSLLIVLLFRKKLQVTNERKARVMNFDESKAIENKPLLVKSLIVLGLVIIAFLFHASVNLEPSTIAMTGAVLLTVLSGSKDIERLFAELEWSTIFFFVGLFIVVGALVDAGVMSLVSNWLITIINGRLKMAQQAILWISSLLSAVIDNIPFVATMVPLIKGVGAHYGAEAVRPLWWALSLGACLGGNGTLIGASANVVSAGLASKSGHPISFWEFTKYGIIFTFVSITVSSIYMFIRY